MNRRSFLTALAAVPLAFTGAFRRLSIDCIGWGETITPTNEIIGGLPRVGDIVDSSWAGCKARVIAVDDSGWCRLHWISPKGHFGVVNEKRDDWSSTVPDGLVSEVRLWDAPHHE